MVCGHNAAPLYRIARRLDAVMRCALDRIGIGKLCERLTHAWRPSRVEAGPWGPRAAWQFVLKELGFSR
eukprot:12161671-Alexandrium_andersonii.AAC.1